MRISLRFKSSYILAAVFFGLFFLAAACTGAESRLFSPSPESSPASLTQGLAYSIGPIASHHSQVVKSTAVIGSSASTIPFTRTQ